MKTLGFLKGGVTWPARTVEGRVLVPHLGKPPAHAQTAQMKTNGKAVPVDFKLLVVRA